MSKKHFYPLTIILVLLICNGCSKENRPDDLPKLYPVTLTITIDGKPLGGALVNLFTEDQSISKWTIGGYTNAEGKLILATHGQFRGAPAGKFKVCVRKSELEGSPGMQEDSRPRSVIDPVPMAGMGGGMPKTIELVAPKFGSKTSTPLEIEVPASKKMLNLTLEVHKP